VDCFTNNDHAGLDLFFYFLPFLLWGGGVEIWGLPRQFYAQGVRLYSVPTSLLAHGTAEVGGNTGVNLPLGKNLVGAYHGAVLADVNF
jgi:3-dehydroquinate synthetase